MSFFSEMETPEPTKRGFFGRLRALKAGFVDNSSAAMPIVGRAPTDGGESSPLQESREPRFKTASKAVNPRQAHQGQPMTMGMMLRRAEQEIEDVEVLGESGGTSPTELAAAAAQSDALVRESSAEASEAKRDFAGSSSNVQSGQERASDTPIERNAEAAAGVSAAPEESTRIPDEEVSESNANMQQSGGYHEPPTVRRIGMDLAEGPEFAIETGRPRLVSAESLTFKRVLCQRERTRSSARMAGSAPFLRGSVSPVSKSLTAAPLPKESGAFFRIHGRRLR